MRDVRYLLGSHGHDMWHHGTIERHFAFIQGLSCLSSSKKNGVSSLGMYCISYKGTSDHFEVDQALNQQGENCEDSPHIVHEIKQENPSSSSLLFKEALFRPLS